MQPGPTTDFLFRQIYHEALCVVGEAAGCSTQIRNVYRAAVLNRNPKHGIVLCRRMLRAADEVSKQLANFKASGLALLAEIEAAIPEEDAKR